MMTEDEGDQQQRMSEREEHGGLRRRSAKKEEEEKGGRAGDIYTPALRYRGKMRTSTYRSLRYLVESSLGTLGRALGTG
jgi:hypothetical protein